MKNQQQGPPQNLLCLSHLRWDFVFQRPQHLLSRFAKEANVYFMEEPIFDTNGETKLTVSKRAAKLSVIVPHLPTGMDTKSVNLCLAQLLEKFFHSDTLNDWTFWYYTPMAFAFTENFKPRLTIFDCMDELSAFDFAPKELIGLEKKLMAKADLVFTGGHSLYEAKQKQHANIFPFPSSIEKEHFEQARKMKLQPVDQASIIGVKIGFYGVIDERFDIELIRTIAEERPTWQIILIGPVVKIPHESLPKNANIHYLGQKSYAELPRYLSGWDVALIPFQLNESTRFISPTKTPEYLAAGVPVVSTPIRDVIKPYGIKKLVHIGENGHDFIKAIEAEINSTDKKKWLTQVDEFLKFNSWDNTYQKMKTLIVNQLNDNRSISIAS
ncbi:glycosyltransferase family 1 protein [Pedobacter sp.]|uniref:glycosyltransferase family 1 protein n=1 Tax=Pedobacter sp. TaxID=1411316 RepID=UPI003D7F28B4